MSVFWRLPPGSNRNGKCAFHLCHMVDPRLHPGLYPAQLVDRSWWHLFLPESPVLQPSALRAKLSGNQTPLTDSELHQKIADAIGVKQSDVALMNARLSGPDTSLNAPVTDSEGSSADRQDFLVSDAPLPDEIVTVNIDAERRRRWLSSALEVLSERELKIVRERRLSEDGATLESLGVKLGISKERVRQIESRAMEKLKSALLAAQPDRAAYST